MKFQQVTDKKQYLSSMIHGKINLQKSQREGLQMLHSIHIITKQASLVGKNALLMANTIKRILMNPTVLGLLRMRFFVVLCV